MHSHAPANYICPFCLALAGVENEHVLTKQSDLVYRDADICAFIAAGGWPNNKGHVLIIPNAHYENLYDLPEPLLCRIHCFSRQVALALKEVYRCDGVTIRQHNEPAGDQDVWHYHVHVLPRYAGDDLYHTQRQITSPQERAVYAQRLRDYFEKE